MSFGSGTIQNSQGYDNVLQVAGQDHAKIISHSADGITAGLYTNDTWQGGAGFVGTETNHDLYFITNYVPQATLTKTGDLRMLSAQAALRFQENGVEKFILGDHSSGNDALAIWNRKNDAIRLATNNTERMTISANGHVGIGTSQPTQKLEVDGTIKTQGIQFADGTTLSTANLLSGSGVTEMDGLVIDPNGVHNQLVPGTAATINGAVHISHQNAVPSSVNFNG
ncbi:MAG: hypothetical protein HC880_07580, partial [Bacteroidia bacterium]|nr:hypothetical protein [Bacteroidia bacterium]